MRRSDEAEAWQRHLSPDLPFSPLSPVSVTCLTLSLSLLSSLASTPLCDPPCLCLRGLLCPSCHPPLWLPERRGPWPQGHAPPLLRCSLPAAASAAPDSARGTSHILAHPLPSCSPAAVRLPSRTSRLAAGAPLRLLHLWRRGGRKGGGTFLSFPLLSFSLPPPPLPLPPSPLPTVVSTARADQCMVDARGCGAAGSMARSKSA